MLKRVSLFVTALLMVGMLVNSSTAQDLTTAEDVLKAHLDATGGEAAWRAVTDLHIELEAAIGTPMGDLVVKAETWSIFPGYGFTEMSLVDGPDGIPAEAVNVKAYYTPLEGWMEQGGQRQDLASANPQVRRQFQRNAAKPELSLLDDEEVTLSLKDGEMFEERPVYVVGVVQDGMESDRLFDQETLLLVAQRMSTPAGDIVTKVGDYKEVEGLLFSTSQTMESAQQSQSVNTKTIEVNTGLKPAVLATKASGSKRAMPE